ncbi:MAG: cell envelope integrity protein CreD [Alphaproteobacteria bacterium]|nr:cell envelope integrity protein CreD [Alphaproteobacteria bacterium]
MSSIRMPGRSLGLKFLLVCLLVLLMSLPAFFVFLLIEDRANRASAVIAEVGQTYGGEQTFVGPILIAPYRAVRPAPPPQPGEPIAGRPTTIIEEGWYVVFAESGRADVEADTDVRSRGDLFKVRTYTANVSFNAAFDLRGEPTNAPPGATIDWARAALLIGVADPRGTSGQPAVTVEGREAIPLEPGSAYANVLNSYVPPEGFDTHRPSAPGNIQWLSADIGDLAQPEQQFELGSQLTITGVESVGVVAFAKNTEIRVAGDWPDVGYFGAFPRVGEADAAPAASGNAAFEARWSIPYVARNVAEAGSAADMGALMNSTVRVRFVDPTNPYQAVTRSLKYAILFIGVVFLAYFLFEATSDTRVHPAQYILVGLAQIIFYLLLLAVSERIGFNWAFLLAAVATVALISYYLGSVFKSARKGFVAMTVFTALYALIYVLMSLEDYALLVGSVAAFVAIAAAMFATRNLDWYGLTADRAPWRDPQAPPAP